MGGFLHIKGGKLVNTCRELKRNEKASRKLVAGRMQVTGFRFQVTGFRLQGSGCRVQVAGYRYR